MIERLISLGFNVDDVYMLNITLNEGYPEDSIPILLKPKYQGLLQNHIFVGKYLYRAQLLTIDDYNNLQQGNILYFDSDYKAWSRDKNVITQFSEPFSDYAYVACLKISQKQILHSINMASLLGIGRWKRYKEVWAKVNGFDKTMIYQIIS